MAKLYRNGRGLVETRQQLNDSLTKWGTATHCSKLIAHATKQVRTWWEAARRADAVDADVTEAPIVINVESDSVSDSEMSQSSGI